MRNEYSGVVGITVDPRLGDIVAAYLEHRLADVRRLRAALEKGELDTVMDLAHDIEGTGTSFGFEHLTEIGRSLQDAASKGQIYEVSELVDEMADWLSWVELVYE